MKRTFIYVGEHDGRFHHEVKEDFHPLSPRHHEYVWFPEIDYGSRNFARARHPRQIMRLIPELVGERIVTMSEHIVLAFQQMVRQGTIDQLYLFLYCGETLVELDEEGDLMNWPGQFFDERLELLR